MRRSPMTLALAILFLGTALGCGVTDEDAEQGDAGETTEPSSEIEPPSSTAESATTTTEEQTTTTGGDGDEAVCGPLQDVSDLDKQFDADLQAGGEWSVIQGKIVDGSEQLVDAYDEAIELAPDDLTEDLTTLRDFTDVFIDVARSSTSLEDFGTKVTEDPNAIAAGAAALNIDEFSRETCGFSTSNE